ncbi:prepilin-type N-terminal cleavage/methylation domain-containing protein [Curtobacterium sp. PhB115]|uniref:prepilin-type N-terminal cleavage/methylation domain-containing protein n=1 Tax=Curtobacterium sp. PhB115 TaxID=2485173 RepID=UPI000FAE2673|nr:prepilin-type N-terminal cleavage/methylation domain-containing protein [Curtobacterium sp. PhB115]ROP72403.1 prepilin-type N-terminal cleavage/methylation domain-containing protein [Curtobacterium sp. PhB115]
MISRIAERLRSARDDEDGFTIIEVMVAMTIFALIAAGIAVGITSSLVLSTDTRAREVASTVAMEDIDDLRDTPSIFDIKSATKSVTVGSRSFDLARKVSWTRSSGAATACGTGDGSLSYKAVTVTVSWKTSATTSGTQQVTMSSAIAPLTNINSDTTGSILVGVTNANGVGLSGIVPTVSGGPAGVTFPATDAEGCTYASGVPAGTYKVSIARTGYIDSTQQASPSSQSVTVSAGASGAAAFTFDKAASYTFKYGTSPASSAIFPTNLPLSVTNATSGTTVLPNSPTSASLFPYPSGYQAVAGLYAADTSSTASATCLSPEPGAWTTANKAGKKGTATPPGAAGVPIDVSMGAITLSKPSKTLFLTAVTTTPITGDPGCATGMTLAFPKPTTDSMTIALPWGTWKLYTGSTAGATTTALTLTTSNTAMVSNGVVNGGVVMVDPRPAG